MPNAVTSLFNSLGHESPFPVLVFVNYGGGRGLVGRVLICTIHAPAGQAHPPPTKRESG